MPYVLDYVMKILLGIPQKFWNAKRVWNQTKRENTSL